MAYTVQIEKRALRELRKIPNPHRARIQAKIEGLAKNPYPSGAEKLQGVESLYRLRVGDYRVIYHVRGKELLVLVVRIGHRRDVYRRL